MFDNLSSKILTGIKKLRGQGKLSQQDVESALKDIRLALLEADVNFKIVKNLIDNIQKKATDAGVIGDLRADQQIVKIVHDELVQLMGEKVEGLNFLGHPPHTI